MEVNERSPTMCDRCGNVGATITCKGCRKTYHGYYCSTLYLISLGEPREYQCFECRNRHNYNSISDSSIEKTEARQMRRNAPRDHILASKITYKSWYLPQVGDEVYYFFQGHEKFIHAYNCFFYCGDEKILPFQYPWIQHAQLTEKPALCRVMHVSHKFPSNKALYLLKKFGQELEYPQTTQIITRVDLQIVSDLGASDNNDFFVEIFPSKQLPEFLVIKELYEHSMN